MTSQAAGRTSEAPTFAQLKDLMAQIESGRVTKAALQAFLRGGVSQTVVDDEFITFTTTGRSIAEQKARYPEITIYLAKSDPVFQKKGRAGRRLSVRNGAVPDSFSKSWDEQQGVLPAGETVPETNDLVDVAVAFKEATGQWPNWGYWLRTADVSSLGRRVYVSSFPSGLYVDYYWDVRYSGIGLSSSWNS